MRVGDTPYVPPVSGDASSRTPTQQINHLIEDIVLHPQNATEDSSQIEMILKNNPTIASAAEYKEFCSLIQGESSELGSIQTTGSALLLTIATPLVTESEYDGLSEAIPYAHSNQTADFSSFIGMLNKDAPTLCGN